MEDVNQTLQRLQTKWKPAEQMPLKSWTSSYGEGSLPELVDTESYDAAKEALELLVSSFPVAREFQISNNPDICYFGDSPTLSELRKNFGIGVVKAWLVLLIENLNEYVGLKLSVNKVQMSELTEIICTNCYWLKVDEILLFLHRFKSGRYLRFYGNFDPMVIMDSLRLFLEERKMAYFKKEQEDTWAKMEEGRKNAVSYDEYLRLKNLSK